MSAADKLAQVLAEHESWMAGGGSSHCDCGEKLDGQLYLSKIEAAHRAHVAAVVLAHLTAEGWAQGNPEYAVSGAIMHPVLSYDHGAATTLHTKHGMPVVRRYVTDWEPVEGGQP